MKTFTIGWLNKCRCGNKSHTVKTARGNESALWDDDAVKCNSCGRGGVIQVCEGQARVLWETNEEMAEGKPMRILKDECNAAADSWNAFRAAMLKGAEPVTTAYKLGNSPVIPDGYVLVPVEPTEDMIIHGFESEPDESFSDEKEWEAYEAMSGCQQAAHRAKLCWAAMIAAAQKAL